MKACADMERTGVPLDVETLRFLQNHWDDVRRDLAGDSLSEYDIFDDLHFSHDKFEVFLKAEGLNKAWPRTEKSKARRLDKETWEEMVALNPELEYLRQLYKTVTMPGLNVACDPDGHSRVLLGAFGTITSRNAPGSDRERGTFVFPPAKWVRFLIKPRAGRALAYLDWSNQEFGIAAVLSGDKNMLRAYEAGDPYLALAILCGAAPVGATKKSHREVRNLYKSATLAIGYGQTEWGFAKKTKVDAATARRVFQNYRRTYSTYIAWREKQVDDYGISLKLSTRLGWTLHHGQRIKPNTILNFGAQANAAEMLRLAIIEMRRRGVEVCCPIHDAVLIQSPVAEIDSAVAEAQAAMSAASAAMLNGYVLRCDCTDDAVGASGEIIRGDITRYPQRFHAEDGKDMWNRVQCALDKVQSTIKTAGTSLLDRTDDENSATENERMDERLDSRMESYLEYMSARPEVALKECLQNSSPMRPIAC